MSEPALEFEVALAAVKGSQQKMLDMLMPRGPQGGMPPMLLTADVAEWCVQHNLILTELVKSFTAEIKAFNRLASGITE